MSTPNFIPGTPRLAVTLAGSGPLLLFMHGIGGNRTNWNAHLPLFAKHAWPR